MPSDSASTNKQAARQQASTDSEWLLKVDNLTIDFTTYYGGIVQAVRGVSFGIRGGSTLAIVGESGCGKSVTAMSLLGLVPMPPGRLSAGHAWFQGRDLLQLSEAEMNSVRGSQAAMIFQDPMTALNPTMTVGHQVAEPLIVHRSSSAQAAIEQATVLLKRCHIVDAKQRAGQYPFEYSGGMLQRVMIATALAGNPKLLIADEPTTALDVTIQAQLLDLMKALQHDEGMAILLITHDLGVVATMADDVAVMYAGRIVESGSAADVFYRSAHPYTLGLRRAIPSAKSPKKVPLKPIGGSPPDLYQPPIGCGYFSRCPYALKLCGTQSPPDFVLPSQGDVVHKASCWLQHPDLPQHAIVTDEEISLYRPGASADVQAIALDEEHTDG